MFKPNDWEFRTIVVQGQYVPVYLNTVTGLHKLRSTFTHEQQRELVQNELSKIKVNYKKYM